MAKVINHDLYLPGTPYSLIERTLVAEFLFGVGYLISELRFLPPQQMTELMIDARRSAIHILEELEFGGQPAWRAGLPVSLN